MPEPTARPADPRQRLERTSFQTGSAWKPSIQLRSDVAMVYGVDPEIGKRVATWRAQGYRVHVMTGVSWGNYQNYLYGQFDGKEHLDEAQTDRNGNKISHGGDVYYMSPGANYGKYLCVGVQRALDAGAEAIHLEEPEFWVRGGYSEGFKREWQDYYHEEWIPPHATPDAQYRASELKYYLYKRALQQVFQYVKDYNRKTGKNVKCYVPTHSLINYAHWRIVSPESSLLQVGADGYIAQVWTGTSRTPNVYEGQRKERTFETAFLEYGAMMNLVRAGKKTVWFLNDPIEDNPDYSWRNYRANWESTLAASLLWPQVWRYEVMPWPDRVFEGRYPVKDRGERAPGEQVAKEPIPAAYATELLTVINALNAMNQGKAAWECGTRGVGVIVSDTMMFHRGDPNPSDENLGSFYGLALPLLKRGIPVEPVQLENAAIPGALKPYRVLLMTYEGMKPMAPGVHAALAKWVKQGNALVFVGDDSDPYNKVKAWWNKGDYDYAAPRQHLFEQLELEKDAAPGTYMVGDGMVIYDTSSPAALTYRPEGANAIRALAKKACEGANLAYKETNYLMVQRGPYVIAAGLDESLPDAPKVLKGRFLDLFDAALPVRKEVALTPGSRHLLYDLSFASLKGPAILAAACKTPGAKRLPDGSFRFYAEAPDKTEAVVRLALPQAPSRVLLDDRELPAPAFAWDAATETLLLRFPNSAQGRWITIRFSP